MISLNNDNNYESSIYNAHHVLVVRIARSGNGHIILRQFI